MAKALMVLMNAFAVTACAANFSGKWAMEIPDRGPQKREVVVILNQVGDEVAGYFPPGSGRGSASPAHTEIWDGQAQGDAISFYVWAGRDQVAKVFYKGKISGDRITFQVTGGAPTYNFKGELNPPAGPWQVTARRTK